MKTLILIIALTATASAQERSSNLGIDGPGGYSWYDGRDWHHFPQAVPEPSSPLVMLIAAGLALIGRRHRPGRIREKRIDLRTVRFP